MQLFKSYLERLADKFRYHNCGPSAAMTNDKIEALAHAAEVRLLAIESRLKNLETTR